MKSEIYDSLSAINHATEQITEHLDKLKNREVVTPDFAQLRKVTADELRSEINLTVALVLAKSEMTDAHAFQQQRIEIEERLKSS
jgi:hypothetical protein